VHCWCLEGCILCVLSCLVLKQRLGAHLVVAHPDAAISQAEAQHVVEEGLTPVVTTRSAKHLCTHMQETQIKAIRVT
jgi:hypothetical protein